MSKYTTAERALVKNIVATLSIKRIPEAEIIRAIFDQAKKLFYLIACRIEGEKFVISSYR